MKFWYALLGQWPRTIRQLSSVQRTETTVLDARQHADVIKDSTYPSQNIRHSIDFKRIKICSELCTIHLIPVHVYLSIHIYVCVCYILDLFVVFWFGLVVAHNSIIRTMRITCEQYLCTWDYRLLWPHITDTNNHINSVQPKHSATNFEFWKKIIRSHADE